MNIYKKAVDSKYFTIISGGYHNFCGERPGYAGSVRGFAPSNGKYGTYGTAWNSKSSAYIVRPICMF